MSEYEAKVIGLVFFGRMVDVGNILADIRLAEISSQLGTKDRDTEIALGRYGQWFGE